MAQRVTWPHWARAPGGEVADIPRSDSLFDSMWTAFMAYAASNLAALGIAPLGTEWVNLLAAKVDWDARYPAHITGQAMAQSLREAKDGSRDVGETRLEAMIAILRANKLVVSNPELEALGLSVYDTIRTPVPRPTTRGLLTVDTSQRQQQKISWVDEATPTSTAKPFGVHGMRLYLKVGGPPPVSLSECKYIVTDTKSPYLYEFDPEDLGLEAHWLGEWENTRGEVGPISETVTATVVA